LEGSAARVLFSSSGAGRETPPWWEQAPRPGLEVVPSLQRTTGAVPPPARLCSAASLVAGPALAGASSRSTPPWCEQAPFPASEVVPSLQRTSTAPGSSARATPYAPATRNNEITNARFMTILLRTFGSSVHRRLRPRHQPLGQRLGQHPRRGADHGGERLLSQPLLGPGHVVRMGDHARQRPAQPAGPGHGPLAARLAPAAQPDRAADEQRGRPRGQAHGQPVLPELRAQIEQRVPAPIQLAHDAGQPIARLLDLAFGLVGPLLGFVYASRSFAHRTSSFRVFCVRSSGRVTRLPQPSQPATPPAASTTTAASSAAAQPGSRCASASTPAIRSRLRPHSAHTAATPRPSATLISRFRSTSISALARATSLLTSSAVCRNSSS